MVDHDAAAVADALAWVETYLANTQSRLTMAQADVTRLSARVLLLTASRARLRAELVPPPEPAL